MKHFQETGNPTHSGTRKTGNWKHFRESFQETLKIVLHKKKS